ncbi:MAG: hypothetical protein PHH37_12435 [Paludibacter sp.]|nr:hypothetical protein [Paludibacter sp.]
MEIAKKEKDDDLKNYVLARQGDYLYKKDPEISIKYERIGYYKVKYHKTFSAIYLAYLYSQKNNLDSTCYFLEYIKKYKPQMSHSPFLNLAEMYIYKNQGQMDSAYEKLSTAYMLSDSIYKSIITKQISRIEKEYDVSVKEKENASLKLENRNKMLWLVTIIALSLLILIGLLLYIMRQKRKQANIELERQRLKYQLEVKEKENEAKKELLLSKLKQRIDLALRFMQIQNGGYQSKKKQEDFVTEIMEKFVLTGQELQDYIDETDTLFEGKLNSISQENPELTKSDITVIALICLGLNVQETCILLNIKTETMYTRRKRIKRHLTNKTDLELEEWITKQTTA